MAGNKNYGQIINLSEEEMCANTNGRKPCTHIHYNQVNNIHTPQPYGNESSRIKWVPSSDGRVPRGAIEAGETDDGEVLYCARAVHGGSIIPGKVHPSHRCCYIPYGGKEIIKRNYEVMVEDN